MMRHVLFLLFVLALTTPVYSQAPNCSLPNNDGVSWNYSPPQNSYCSSGQNGTTFSNTVVYSSTETCENTNTDSTYASHNATVTGYGQTNCNFISNLEVWCYADYDQQMTDAANASDYNRFYLRSYDRTYVGNNTCARNGAFRQDFWQCQGVACSDCVKGPKPSGSCWTWSIDQCQWVYNATGNCNSPLLIDVTGKGFFLTSAENGVVFDISGTGHLIQIGWTARGAENAFLALPGSDGLVHNGKELFGNFTSQPPSEEPNGFAALAIYDLPKNGGNDDGIIDERDGVFQSLRLWIDDNHDGICQLEEMHTLASLGVNSISLNYRKDRKTDQYGNLFRYRARLNPDQRTEDGKILYDVFFVTLPPPDHAAKLGVINPQDSLKAFALRQAGPRCSARKTALDAGNKR